VRPSIPTHRLIALLLGLCLQFQALAAVVMPCAHAAQGQGHQPLMATGCPHDTVGHPEVPVGDPIACVKCALIGLCGVYSLPTLLEYSGPRMLDKGLS